MRPVSPIPPAVAQNRSGSDSGDTVTVPVGVTRVELGHVLAEAAVDVMVLAVDVGGDGPAHRHVAGAGGDGHEPAERDQALHEGLEADAGADGDLSGDEVGAVDGVEPGGVEDHAPGVLGGVAVAASEAAGDEPPVGRRRPTWRRPWPASTAVDVDGRDHLGGARCRPAPAAQQAAPTLAGRHRGSSGVDPDERRGPPSTARRSAAAGRGGPGPRGRRPPPSRGGGGRGGGRGRRGRW